MYSLLRTCALAGCLLASALPLTAGDDDGEQGILPAPDGEHAPDAEKPKKHKDGDKAKKDKEKKDKGKKDDNSEKLKGHLDADLSVVIRIPGQDGADDTERTVTIKAGSVIECRADEHGTALNLKSSQPKPERPAKPAPKRKDKDEDGGMDAPDVDPMPAE
ncbi:MAG: hypothetical protein PF961_10100 [Planctomycetota bacterium]|jgi:hypothetical protein|nr:hypothetical protein [Planctomycetota bacterium]